MSSQMKQDKAVVLGHEEQDDAYAYQDPITKLWSIWSDYQPISSEQPTEPEAWADARRRVEAESAKEVCICGKMKVQHGPLGECPHVNHPGGFHIYDRFRSAYPAVSAEGDVCPVSHIRNKEHCNCYYRTTHVCCMCCKHNGNIPAPAEGRLELLPCPWCGEIPNFHDASVEGDDSMWIIGCQSSSCAITSRTAPGPKSEYETMKSDWNTRAKSAEGKRGLLPPLPAETFWYDDKDVMNLVQDTDYARGNIARHLTHMTSNEKAALYRAVVELTEARRRGNGEK